LKKRVILLSLSLVYLNNHAMLPSLRPRCWIALPILALTALWSQAQPKALPLTAPMLPGPIPAVLDAVTFDVHADGENHKLVVMSTPSILRVDDQTDGYSILYYPLTQQYTGLEHLNYTYWQFSWPAVKTAIENSKRYETRLKDLGVESLNGDSPAPSPTDTASATAAPPTDMSPPGVISSDDSGYVWKPGTEKKRIAGLDCVRWTSDSLTGEPVEAWCYAGPLPKVEKALEQLHEINDPIALVPVRTLVPPLVFDVTRALAKGGVTPVLITWGGDQDRSRFELLSVKTHEGRASLFSIPKTYNKTTLITMDGLLSPVPDIKKRSDEGRDPVKDHEAPPPRF
jgi:hypothetical protein